MCDCLRQLAELKELTEHEWTVTFSLYLRSWKFMYYWQSQHSLFYFCFSCDFFYCTLCTLWQSWVLILPVLNSQAESESESERVMQPAHLADRTRPFFIALDNVVKSLKTTLQHPNLIIAHSACFSRRLLSLCLWNTHTHTHTHTAYGLQVN